MRTNHFYRYLDPTQARVLAAVQKPEKFLQRARPVLQLYEQATSLLEQDTWMVCADEKTSFQARQAEQAPRPGSVNYC